MLALLYTIGHSTRLSLDDLIETLHAHQIQTLADIRAFPMSRRLPQFNRESLEKSLPAEGIRYVWMKNLAAIARKVGKTLRIIALRNLSFRNYADCTLIRSSRRRSLNWLQSPKASALPICVPSAYTSAAIAC